MSTDDLVVVGKVVRAHGLRGGLVVRPAFEGSDLLLGVERIVLEKGGQRREREVLDARPHGKQLLLQVSDVGDRTLAESIVGAEVLVSRDDYPDAGEDEFWALDLLGLPVRSPGGEELGVVVEVETSPLQDWLVVERGAKRHLVPLTAPLCVVDEEAGCVVVDAPEGLFEE